MSIYTDIVAAGIPHNNHYSDLYVPDTPEVRAILARHGKKVDGWNVQPFTNRVEGGRWLDLPFQYEPYWASRGKG